MRGAVATALGPRAETRTIQVGLGGLVLEDVRVHAPSDWPAEESLFAAERLAVAPRLITLLSEHVVRIRSIELLAPYLSALRTRDRGLEALPGLFGGEAAPPGEDANAPARGSAKTFAIGEIEIESGVLELFDATIASPPQKIRLEQIEASVRDLSLPGLAGRSEFELDAVVKGKARDGRARLSGWTAVADRDSDVSIELRGVDLAPLQAYLLKPGRGARAARQPRPGPARRGQRREARGARPAHARRARAASDGGIGETFLGVPHQIVLASLKDRGGRLSFDFTLSGDVDSPHFSLNEALGKQIAFALAEDLGFTVGGVVKGVGSLGVRGGKALGEAAKDAGGAILDLLEGERK